MKTECFNEARLIFDEVTKDFESKLTSESIIGPEIIAGGTWIKVWNPKEGGLIVVHGETEAECNKRFNEAYHMTRSVVILIKITEKLKLYSTNN